MPAALEPLIREIGNQLHRDAVAIPPTLFRSRGVRGALLARALADDNLRQALFQFIDVLPQLENGESVARHFRAYLDGHDLAGAWGRLLKLGNHPALAWAVRASVTRMARLFLVEENPVAVKRVLTELARSGASATLDAVGEAVLTTAEADAYVARYRDLLRWQHAAGVERPHLSLKLTALVPRFDPLDPRGTGRRVLARLQPLLDEIIRANAALTIDMEQYELKPLIFKIFKDMVAMRPAGDWRPGIALQAYLPETESDIA